jgi:MtfA peptidase
VTSALLILLGILVAVVAPALVWPRLKLRRRERICAAPFPVRWRSILESDLPIYRRLPPDLRDRLEHDINVFVAEKEFAAGKGITISDRIRVVIAAQACLLTLNRPRKYYPSVHTIYVYPSAFWVEKEYEVEGGLFLEGGEEDVGESWDDGRLRLAWDSARHGAAGDPEGISVVIHEFAHVLDLENGETDGVPMLEDQSQAQGWLAAYEKELRRQRKGKGSTVIDEYGLSDPAEFFAVAGEAFFEQPRVMLRELPELYERLKMYYQLDPAAWGRA